MDVWFDSGSSWAGVLGGDEALNYPADLYLEVGRWCVGGSAGFLCTLLQDVSGIWTLLPPGSCPLPALLLLT